jgi:hypothetical protein
LSNIDRNGDYLKNFTRDEIQSMLKESQNLYCPFCGELEFNQVGLKSHLMFHCKIMRDVDSRRDENGRLL